MDRFPIFSIIFNLEIDFFMCPFDLGARVSLPDCPPLLTALVIISAFILTIV